MPKVGQEGLASRTSAGLLELGLPSGSSAKMNDGRYEKWKRCRAAGSANTGERQTPSADPWLMALLFLPPRDRIYPSLLLLTGGWVPTTNGRVRPFWSWYLPRLSP